VDSLRWVKPADETADVKPLADKLAEEMKVQAVAAGTTPEITAAGEKQFQPQDIARAKVLQERVRANWMYLTNDALDKSFTKEEVGATISALWAAQVNLWASQDIFAAIRQTNESVLKGLKEEDQNVLNAPVKRLVSVKIGAAHVTGGSIANEVYFTAREGPAAPAGGGFAPVGTQRRTVIETGSGSELTERACSTKYDVVHYRFAVVMPTRYVEALLINLMRQGNHTVEKVEMAEPKTAEAGTTLFYYGPEPVLEVTVFGELLLLTAWERGTADPQKPGEWLQAYPPLMPEEVLKGLQELSPSALRPEDNQRLELFRSGQPPR
jgi:hypothetical protein